MRRIRTALVIATLVGFGLQIPAALAADAKKAAPAKKAPAKSAKAKATPPKKKEPPPMVNAEHKKALAEKFAGFKFGMTKDEVLAVLQKQINERFEEKIKATTDVAMQDRYRKDKKAELARTSSTYVEFNGKKGGWDVSIVENEFAHNTGESMMERWENDGGKNQRRFFFFYNQRLWKMFISLDVSMIPDDKRNFDTFKGVMEGQYGKGGVDGGTIAWRAGEFDVRAIDRLKDYGALGLVLEDPKVRSEVVALRESKAPPKQETPSVIKAIIDPDNKDHPDVKSNSGAVEAVIQGNGAATPPKK
ncbi:MAG TPA: hypothetical protein VFV99_23745 [Kofleriaceae bacterium]|nr:hypothetical protein [Kofleriaceae bacterium]